jgi:hypothetical protein
MRRCHVIEAAASFVLRRPLDQPVEVMSALRARSSPAVLPLGRARRMTAGIS